MKTYFSQNDKNWKNKTLGFSKLTLGKYGCFVVALANLSGIKPDRLNDILKKEKCFDGADIISSKRMANSLGLDYLGKVDKNYHIKYRTIAEVDASKRAGIQEHFVVVKPDGSIIDSWDGKIKPKGTYPIVNYRLFKRLYGYQEAPQSDVNCKDLRLSLKQIKATLNGYILKVKELQKTIRIQKEMINDLESVYQKNAKDAKIVDSLVFFIKSIIAKLK